MIIIVKKFKDLAKKSDSLNSFHGSNFGIRITCSNFDN